jgi:rhamnose utilization protein RhaD (predicted bifunctional aldolase and dehydrogenase)/NAD(P)-dependent dehydrogenase (short-subunit alcohol dehydrogenase family)
VNPPPATTHPAAPAPGNVPGNALEVLIELSRRYGGDPAFVLAGGGNTSVKVGDVLHVKASGTALAHCGAGDFVAMDRGRLSQLAQADLGPEPVAREARFKQAIYAARLHPEKNQRPSVEVLLHHLVPGRFVVHTHATMVNALTCCTAGPELARAWFGDEVLWLPYVDPGFVLAQTLQQALAQYQQRTGRTAPMAILMANHGLLVAGDDGPEVEARTARVLDTIRQRLGGRWQQEGFGPVTRLSDPAPILRVAAPMLRALLAEPDAPTLPIVTFDDSDLALSLAGAEQGLAVALGGPLIPDQIVYCGSLPLWIDLGDAQTPAAILERLRTTLDQHVQTTGFRPKIVLIRGLGLLAGGADYAQADTARQVYLDAVAVMAGARRLGGIRYLDAAQRRFIEQWEVESYRRQVAAGSGGSGAGRAAGKIALITGAAQGVGLGIAQAWAAAGGHVVLADMNEAGVRTAAAEVCRSTGAGRAVGLALDVSAAGSVAAALDAVVRRYGGFDLLISNAGVLRAGSVKTMSDRDFDLVTAVNYKGFFVCVRQAAPIFAAQHQARPGYRSDILQVNSKSGLVGSNRNAAYAGSKFGGIGLTQSFALELIEDGIKVNAICPGNFFDLPLWSDPDHGLFVQYLRADKVPGAKTVADVRRAYEAKIPMGRGCTVADVMHAILYLMDQPYETGQALPVTGGQVMLS